VSAQRAIDVRLSLIVAADEQETIGNEGHLPWHLPEDLKRFRALTTGHVVIAGRLTQDSIVARLGGPLPNRTTVVVTRRGGGADGRSVPGSVHYAHSVPEAIERAKRLEAGGPHERTSHLPEASPLGGTSNAPDAAGKRPEVFVIGGAQIYRECLPEVTTVYLTRVHKTVPGDRAMPPGWLHDFGEPVERHARDGFSFETYERPRP
jgi:dihydrofolate reductase